MKLSLVTILILFLTAGCALSQKTQPSKAYVESVKQMSQDGKTVLKISGNYPNGCTYLEEVTHEIKNDGIHLQLSARQDADAMCTQALVPFSFVYDKLSKKEIYKHTKVIIEGTVYEY